MNSITYQHKDEEREVEFQLELTYRWDDVQIVIESADLIEMTDWSFDPKQGVEMTPSCDDEKIVRKWFVRLANKTGWLLDDIRHKVEEAEEQYRLDAPYREADRKLDVALGK